MPGEGKVTHNPLQCFALERVAGPQARPGEAQEALQ